MDWGVEGRDHFKDPTTHENRWCSSFCQDYDACKKFCPYYEATTSTPYLFTTVATTSITKWIIPMSTILGVLSLLGLILVILHRKFGKKLPCLQTGNTCSECTEKKQDLENARNDIRQRDDQNDHGISETDQNGARLPATAHNGAGLSGTDQNGAGLPATAHNGAGLSGTDQNGARLSGTDHNGAEFPSTIQNGAELLENNPNTAGPYPTTCNSNDQEDFINIHDSAGPTTQLSVRPPELPVDINQSTTTQGIKRQLDSDINLIVKINIFKDQQNGDPDQSQPLLGETNTHEPAQ